MKKFVQIASTMNIDVAPDLRCINATNPTAPMADKLSVKSVWSRFIVPLKQGMFWYPAQVKEWTSVKCLEKDGLVTIGAESDTCPKQDEVEALAKKLANAETRFENDKINIEKGRQQVISNSLENTFKNITSQN